MIDGDAFKTYIADILPPTLTPSDIVVMDNLPAYKVALWVEPARTIDIVWRRIGVILDSFRSKDGSTLSKRWGIYT